MNKLIFIVFTLLSYASGAFSQTELWKYSIGREEKQEILPSIYTHLNNRYIVCTADGDGINAGTQIAIVKTELNGDTLWTKYYRPGEQLYNNFTTTLVNFKDSTMLIYGLCGYGSTTQNQKFLYTLNLDGEEIAVKIFDHESTLTIFNANLSDSSTVECVYYDYETNKRVRYEQYNKKLELIHEDSLVYDLQNTKFRTKKDTIYAIEIFKNPSNYICLKLYRYNKYWSLIDSTIYISEINLGNDQSTTYAFPTVSQVFDNDDLLIDGSYVSSSTQNDNYVFRLNVQTKTLVAQYYSKKNNLNSYVILNNAALYKNYNNDVISIVRMYQADSTQKYIYLLSRISNDSIIWKLNVKAHPNIDFNSANKLISLDVLNDRILVTIYFEYQFDKGQAIYIYNKNGKYLNGFVQYFNIIHNYPVFTLKKSIFANSDEILSIGQEQKSGRPDYDIFLMKTKFDSLFASVHFEKQELLIYPNPAKDYIFINGLEWNDNEIIVIDILGKRKKLKNINNIINTTELIPGVYIIEIGRRRGKLIIR